MKKSYGGGTRPKSPGGDEAVFLGAGFRRRGDQGTGRVSEREQMMRGKEAAPRGVLIFRPGKGVGEKELRTLL